MPAHRSSEPHVVVGLLLFCVGVLCLGHGLYSALVAWRGRPAVAVVEGGVMGNELAYSYNGQMRWSTATWLTTRAGRSVQVVVAPWSPSYADVAGPRPVLVWLGHGAVMVAMGVHLAFLGRPRGLRQRPRTLKDFEDAAEPGPDEPYR